MRAVILTRISSKEQQEGHSLDAQRGNLERYAANKNMNVVRSYSLVESSTKRQRPEFDEMIKFITQQKGKVALIIDTVDRLQRSFRETPILNELMQRDVLELHFVKEGNVLSKDASSTQKLMWNMGVVMAQSYTDQLSDNVKRSMKHKVQSGEWISKAPIGYYNDADKITGKSILTLDRSTSPFIKRVFEEYATGLYSIHEIKRRADDWGPFLPWSNGRKRSGT